MKIFYLKAILILEEKLKIIETNLYKKTSDSIENLPEWLICLVGENLIRVTAIKQKTTAQIESVSIDTDAYVLKKYDGCRKFEK